MRWTLAFLFLLPRNVLVLVLMAYRRIISPLYGEVCRYYPSCSSYSLTAIGRQGVVRGTVSTVWRLLRCNPWSPGGVNEVAPLNHLRYRFLASGLVLPRIYTFRSHLSSFDFFASPATAHSHRKG